MQKLTKEMILKGTNARDVIEIEEIGGAVTIRPLCDSELAEVRSVALRGLSPDVVRQLPKMQAMAKAGKEIDDIGMGGDDLMQAQENDARGNLIAAAYGLSCDGEKWKPEEVGNLPPGVPEKIAKAVFKVTGATKGGAVEAKKFRDDDGRAGNTGTA